MVWFAWGSLEVLNFYGGLDHDRDYDYKIGDEML